MVHKESPLRTVCTLAPEGMEFADAAVLPLDAVAAAGILRG